MFPFLTRGPWGLLILAPHPACPGSYRQGLAPRAMERSRHGCISFKDESVIRVRERQDWGLEGTCWVERRERFGLKVKGKGLGAELGQRGGRQDFLMHFSLCPPSPRPRGL